MRILSQVNSLTSTRYERSSRLQPESAPAASSCLPAPTSRSVLSIPIFRMLWIATLVSNVGTWTQEVASSWLMTEMAPDPVMVSLVQAATALPMFLLGLPAGALADMVDKRRWLIATQSWMLLSAAVMAIVTLGGFMNPCLLLLGSFCLSIGTALNSPGWHSVTPEIVPKESLHVAVTLNGVVINCARAIGPAIGGLVVVKLGAGAAFSLNALSFLAVVFVLHRWRRENPLEEAPVEPFVSAMRVGLQHVRHSPLMRVVIARTAILIFASSVVWALLPLLCKEVFGFGPRGYGMLLVANGVGAIFGAMVVLPRLRQFLNVNQIVGAAWLGFIPTLLVLYSSAHPAVLFAAMLWGGACNLCILSSFHLTAQSVAPDWVRARAMAIYLLVFFGATCFGSIFWGAVAREVGMHNCLLLGAAFLLQGLFTTLFTPLKTGEHLDHRPAHCWPEPDFKVDIPLQHGPILVTVEFQIAPDDAEAFREAMEEVRKIRYRNGVRWWSLYLVLENPTLYREVYLEETWAAHVRQHQRISQTECEISDRAYRYHRGPGKPVVSHSAICDHEFPA
ncbi:MAG: MFS transporter [Vulcanimicrobiota bacterium]